MPMPQNLYLVKQSELKLQEQLHAPAIIAYIVYAAIRVYPNIPQIYSVIKCFGLPDVYCDYCIFTIDLEFLPVEKPVEFVNN